MLELVAAAAAIAAGPPALPLRPCTLARTVSARCGTLAVPEDRRRPNGRRIRIFVGVVRAYGSTPRKEPIFYLSGGPGAAAATGDAAFAATTFLEANRNRDLVLVDQRGVGRSASLMCPPSPARTVPEALAAARKCLRDVRRDPRLYTTDAAMDDVDAVRRALGHRRIAIYGGSYGASAAQVYLARHGSHVAAAVLDGATLLDVPIWERMPRATQDSFDQIARLCRRRPACAGRFPDVAGDLRRVITRLRAGPVRVRLGDAKAEFGPAEAQEAVRLMLRDAASAVRVPLALRRAVDGDFGILSDLWAASAPGGAETARKLMYWAIRCGEGWSRARPAAIRRAAAGTWFLESSLETARDQQLVCPLLGKPLPAPDTGRVPRSRAPVLFLVGGLDPQDPYANVAHARRYLPNAHILVVPGAGHGAVQIGCLPRVAGRFLSVRRVTAADRACARSVQPPPFALRP